MAGRSKKHVSRAWSNIIVALMLTAIIIAIPFGVRAELQESRRLVLFQGFILLAYYDNQYFEVKRLDPTQGRFYGYGWLDKDKVFVAYDLEQQGEAIADMEIIDLRQSKIVKLQAIGGVGESRFDVNTSRGEVIYSKESGIRLVSIETDLNKYQIYDYAKDVFCWAAFWVNDNTVGCRVYDDKSEKFVFKKYPIPSLEVIKKTKGIKSTDLKWSVKEFKKQ